MIVIIVFKHIEMYTNIMNYNNSKVNKKYSLSEKNMLCYQM